jgi:hypothetical protein
MEGTPGLHDTLEQVLRQHQNWMDCQYLKPLAWMIVRLIQARAIGSIPCFLGHQDRPPW